jgi:hypothetical protein
LAFLAWYLIHFYVRAGAYNSEVSAAAITYFAQKLLRDGHWFSPEMYFFVWLYVLICHESKLMAAFGPAQAPIAKVSARAALSGPTSPDSPKLYIAGLQS